MPYSLDDAFSALTPTIPVREKQSSDTSHLSSKEPADSSSVRGQSKAEQQLLPQASATQLLQRQESGPYTVLSPDQLEESSSLTFVLKPVDALSVKGPSRGDQQLPQASATQLLQRQESGPYTVLNPDQLEESSSLAFQLLQRQGSGPYMVLSLDQLEESSSLAFQLLQRQGSGPYTVLSLDQLEDSVVGQVDDPVNLNQLSPSTAILRQYNNSISIASISAQVIAEDYYHVAPKTKLTN